MSKLQDPDPAASPPDGQVHHADELPGADELQGADEEWWQGCIIYQIYPRSFNDTNADGVGDLRGVVEKLEYVASLGVDAIWLSPFFESPMRDYGYDVSNYRAVDPIFGDLEDFRQLVDRAHALGLKLIIDQVLSHTSDLHEWFKSSRRDRQNPYADWYVWADPKPDGTAPNNWLSLFGGPAWTWDSRREQYYLHNFLPSQPDLNFHNPEVQERMLEEVEFWLRLGVDGVRLDACNFYFHDRELRDNPAKPRRADGTPVVRGDNPYSYQQHMYSVSQPECLEFHRRLRELLARYPGTTSVGEITTDNALEVIGDYLDGGDKLCMGYTFDLLTTDFDCQSVMDIVCEAQRHLADGWPCWSASNHDVVRTISRTPEPHSPSQAVLILAFMASVRGSVCIYQGEELGLPEADIPFHQIQDPYGIPFWPEFKGRDGCRTPMPWDGDAAHGGFSEAEPWLPVTAAHLALSCDRQEQDPASTLHRFRRFMAWRGQQPALRRGSFRLLDVQGQGGIFLRQHPRQTLLVALNFSHETLRLSLPAAVTVRQPLEGHGFSGEWDVTQGEIVLPPWEAFFAEVDAG